MEDSGLEGRIISANWFFDFIFAELPLVFSDENHNGDLRIPSPEAFMNCIPSNPLSNFLLYILEDSVQPISTIYGYKASKPSLPFL